MNILRNLFAKKAKSIPTVPPKQIPESPPEDFNAADVLLDLAERRDVDLVLRGLDAHLERVQEQDREPEALRLLSWAEEELNLAQSPQPAQYALLGNICQRLQPTQNADALQRALGFYSVALTGYEEARELEGTAVVLNNMGLALLTLARTDARQYAEAIPVLEEALHFYENGEDWPRRADICLSLGEAYAGLEEPGFDHYELGRECLERSRALYERCDDEYGQAMAQGQLGDVHVELAVQDGQISLEKAVRHYRNALALFVDLGEPLVVARYQERLGNAYGSLGEEEHLRKSLRAAQRAVELYEKHEQQAALARAGLGLARIHLALVGCGAEDELLPGFEQLRRTLGLFRDLKDRSGRAACLLLLAQIYQYGESDRQDADLRQAFDCLTEALAIYRLQGQDEAAALVQRQLHALEQPDAYTG
jgi:tetratricopeptide (TPR) repeat protein